MKIGNAILGLVRNDPARQSALMHVLMKACNEYAPHFAMTPELGDIEDADLDDILRLGLEQWVSGIGLERMTARGGVQ